MKIPTVLAQTDAPSSLPTNRYSGAEDTASVAMARAANQLNATAQSIGGAEIRIERERQARASRQEAGALSSQADMESAAFLENLKLVTGDPDEYKKMAEEGLKGINDRTLQATKNEQTKTLLQTELQKVGGKHALGAIKYSNDLFSGTQIGRMGTELANRKTTMSLLDPGDDKAWVEEYQKGVAAIDNASVFLGPEKAAKARIEWRGDVAKERAYREVKADSQANVERYRPLMSPEQWKWVEDRQGHFQDMATKERERLQKQAEKDAEEARVRKLAQISQMGQQRTLTESLIDQAFQVGIIKTPQELEHAYSLLKPKETPSDPIVYQQLSAKVFHPDVTSRSVIAEIQRAMTVHNQGGKGLDEKDGTRLLQHASSEIQREEKEAYTIAMNEGLTALGIPPTFGQWDKKQRKLAAQFTQMMNAIAKPANPNGVGGREALQQALPVLQAIQDQDTRLDFTDQWKIVSPWAKTPQPDPLDQKGYEAWHADQVQQIEALKAENPAKNTGTYYVRRRQLEDLLSAAKDMAEAASRRGGKSSSSSSGSGRSVGGYEPGKK